MMKDWDANLVVRVMLLGVAAVPLILLASTSTADPPPITAPPLAPGVRAVLTEQTVRINLVGWYGVQVKGLTHTYNTAWNGTRAKVTIEPLHGVSEVTGEYCQGEVLVTFEESPSGFDGVYCDVNGDGRVDMLDMHEVLKHMTGPPVEEDRQ